MLHVHPVKSWYLFLVLITFVTPTTCVDLNDFSVEQSLLCVNLLYFNPSRNRRLNFGAK